MVEPRPETSGPEDLIDTTLRLQPKAENVATARRLVRSALAGWGSDNQAEIVVLLTSELVTNAIVHGGPHRSTLLVHLDCADGRARVEVTDASTARPLVGDGSPDEGSGRGMVLVDRLASTWGVVLADDGKVVWFEVRA